MEQSIAGLFGARRNRGSGSGGRSDCSRSDSTHPRLYVECKYAQKHPLVFEFLAMKKAAKAAKGGPVLAMRIISEREGVAPLIAFSSRDIDEVSDAQLGRRTLADRSVFRNKLAARTLIEDAKAKVLSSKPDRGKVPLVVLKNARQTGVLLVVEEASLEAVLAEYRKHKIAREEAEDAAAAEAG